MKQKRYRKLLMSIGKSRNAAENYVRTKPDGASYDDLWDINRLYSNQKTLSKEKPPIFVSHPELFALCAFICFGGGELHK